MFEPSLSHLSDRDLLRALAAVAAQERVAIAKLLALIAEVDRRRLYVAAGYSSMHAYCVGELHLSEDAAWRRIQASRVARRFPLLFVALATGRLHLTAVCMLAPHVTPENARELVESATHRRRSEIEKMLARRFPLPAEPSGERPVIRVLPALPSPAPARVNSTTQDSIFDTAGDESSEPAGEVKSQDPSERSETQPVPRGEPVQPESLESESLQPAGTLRRPAAPEDGVDRSHPEGSSDREMPCSPERYLVKLTIEKSTHDKLRYAQTLLSHAVPSGDVAQVIDRALDILIAQLQKGKFAACTLRPRVIRPTSTPRHIPAHVRRAVWRRDRAQCTFVSATGHRCEARRLLEFDHIDPVANGGRPTVEGIRLRCRAHNQYEAERVFGADFMARKREEARRLRKSDAAARTDGPVTRERDRLIGEEPG